jgi:hypothetical protein
MPPLSEQEAAWATALEKSRQQQMLSAKVPLPVQQAHARESWQHHKAGLLRSLHEQDEQQATLHLQKAILARAEMMSLFLRELESQFGEISEDVIAYHTTQYLQDCARITHAADILTH